jgi:LuxR family maltose regulon positive regulatory protein
VELLDDAERTYVGDFSPNVQPVHAVRARAWIRQGRLDDAFEWVRDQGLSTEDQLSYLREYEHVTLARALIAGSALDQATGLLKRLLLAATDGQRTGARIEIQVLQAMAFSLRGDVPAALLPLGRALVLAEPEGYLRMFVAEGAAMKTLLAAATEQGISPSYTERLLPAFERKPVQEGLVDPLSQRELEVLRLLGTELSGPEIADHLVVALNTVRTHTKNIYAKLGVTNRRAAVRLGEELDLLSQPSSR